jgi:hypothetical protein
VSGLLEGQIADAIYAGFKGKLLVGTLWRSVPAISGGLDARGDPEIIDPVSWRCQGFVDGYDAAYRARAGIPETDSKVCIFAQSIPGVRPAKDDKVLFRGEWWQLRSVATDPATALWVCQAFIGVAPQ